MGLARSRRQATGCVTPRQPPPPSLCERCWRSLLVEALLRLPASHYDVLADPARSAPRSRAIRVVARGDMEYRHA
eukprot:1182295-Prorocentrum_minimum.AAC.2